MRAFIRKLNLTFKFVALTGIIFVVTALFEHLYIIHSVNNYYYKKEYVKLSNIANIIAKDSKIIKLMTSNNANEQKYIQEFAEIIRETSNFDFVVFMDMNGIRFSHPKPQNIGLKVVGDDEKLTLNQGKQYHSKAIGTLGASIRYFTPVIDNNGKQIGALLVGTTVNKLEYLVGIFLGPVFNGLFISLLLAIGFSILLARSIKKSLFFLEPYEIAKILTEKNTILESTKEGIIAIDNKGKITLINQQAKKILISNNYIDSTINIINSILPNTKLLNVIRTGTPEYDVEEKIGNATILTNRIPLIVEDQIVGAIATFRDMTEIRDLADNITGINKYVDALRSQSHEFNNQLHVIYGLAFNDKKQEILRYLENIIGNKHSEGKVIRNSIKDPILAAFLNSKYSRARELNIKLKFNITTTILPIQKENISKNLVSIIGNLIDNAMESFKKQQNKNIIVNLDIEDEILIIKVQDNGPGIDKEIIDKIFNKNFSTKGPNRGFGLYLVINIIHQLNGEIQINTSTTKNVKGTCFTVLLPLEKIYSKENI